MKNLGSLKISVCLVLWTLLIVSCEKSEVNTDTNQTIEEEGFKSITENSDLAIKNIDAEANRPVLHMHFDKDVSKEEATRLWEATLDNYVRNQQIQNKGFNDNWICQLWTRTGTNTHNKTDGRVVVFVEFATDKGYHVTPVTDLNNPGNDREGGWDAYAIVAAIPNQNVEWVEVKSANLYLKGTDGWFITHFEALLASDLNPKATGRSSFLAFPNIWLDNNTADGWDRYTTGFIGTGRITF